MEKTGVGEISGLSESASAPMEGGGGNGEWQYSHLLNKNTLTRYMYLVHHGYMASHGMYLEFVYLFAGESVSKYMYFHKLDFFASMNRV